MTSVTVLKRDRIPEIHSIEIAGVQHYLGILKDFRWAPEFAEFVPPEAPTSMSWVHLGAGEILTPHVHPVSSMIIVCEGNVMSLGEVETELSAGDALLVPAGRQHGFKGLGPDGFWGLSVQFEPRSLYQDTASPQVTFVRDEESTLNAKAKRSLSGGVVPRLLALNEHHLGVFADNLLFRMVRSRESCFAEFPEEAGAVFLAYFQVWSNSFQRMVLSRAAFCDDPRFMALAMEHLEEELGHNTALSKSRDKPAAREAWDPILEASCEWFVQKMLTLDNAERTVLVHLVVEASATVFYAHFGPLMQRMGQGTAHFDKHSGGVDNSHAMMGLDLLKDLPPKDLDRLAGVQAKGWEMLNTLFRRIGELVAATAFAGVKQRSSA